MLTLIFERDGFEKLDIILNIGNGLLYQKYLLGTGLNKCVLHQLTTCTTIDLVCSHDNIEHFDWTCDEISVFTQYKVVPEKGTIPNPIFLQFCPNWR